MRLGCIHMGHTHCKTLVLKKNLRGHVPSGLQKLLHDHTIGLTGAGYEFYCKYQDLLCV